MFKTTKHRDNYKAKIHKQFKAEFGIHFQDKAELRFALQFLDDVIDEVIKQAN